MYPGDTHILGTTPTLCQRGSRERLFAAHLVSDTVIAVTVRPIAAPTAAAIGREMAR